MKSVVQSVNQSNAANSVDPGNQSKMTIIEPNQFDDYEPVRCTNIIENEGPLQGSMTSTKKRTKLTQ